MAGFKYHVFLSHSSTDKPAVEELAVRLRREGIEPWLDKWNLVPGQAWQPAIEKALNDCATCAVVIGAGGFGAWQNEEMRAAIDRRVGEGQSSFRVIPVLLPGVDRPARGKLPTFLTATTWVEFRKSLDDAEAFRRLVCGIQGREPGAGPEGAAFEGTCPYRGLEVFDVEHAPFFFGREALTEWLTVALRPSPSGVENRFLAILGASGSGKSSLARAGLAAALKRGAIEGSGDWPIVIFKPGHDPIESLSIALAGLPGGAALIKDTRDLLNIKNFGDDPKSLHMLARLALRDVPRSRRLVVLVDQAEEAFTLCEDASARQAFFDNLLYAATVADGQAIVVLTMRADFYGRCASHSALAAAMSDHQLLVGPMTEDELGRAIERPAQLAGGEFEPGLVEMLLQDVSGRPGALPLLQFALTELWQRREVRLTVEVYKALGGIKGALEHRADDVLKSFDNAQREVGRRIFLRLTQPGEGSEDTKRRASFDELVSEGANPNAVETVIRRLADARLITTEGDSTTEGGASVEVAHEALIRGWTQLRQWIDADRTGLLIHRQLADAARAWHTHGRESSFLYAGSRLVVAREWAKRHRDELNALEKAFLAASVRNRLIGKVVSATSILLVIALAVGSWMWFQSRERTRLSRITQAVEEDLKEAAERDDQSRWLDAVDLLKVAQNRREPGVGNDALWKRVDENLAEYTKKANEWKYKDDAQKAEKHDNDTIAALETARLMGAGTTKEGGYDRKAIVSEYQRTFRAAGIDIDTLPPEKAAEQIGKRSPVVREALAAALEDWAWDASPPHDSRLRAIARLADPDPWRNTIRDALAKGDVKALRQRAHDAEVESQSAARLDRLGNDLLFANERVEAQLLLQRAQRLHPHDFWINHDLAFAFEFTSPPQYNVESIRYYTVAVAIRPDSPGANRDLGLALRETHPMDAIVYFDKAIRLDPTSAPLYIYRSGAYFAIKQYDKAIADFDTLIGFDPKSDTAYSERGDAYLAKRDFDKAIADYDKAIDLNPKRFLTHANRGFSYFVKQDFGKALADYDKAIDLDRGLAWAHNGCAWIYATCPDEKYRDGKKAIESATRACELSHWKYAPYLDTLAAAYAEAGDFDAAIKWDEKALGLLTKNDHLLPKDLESHLALYRAKKPFHEPPRPARP